MELRRISIAIITATILAGFALAEAQIKWDSEKFMPLAEIKAGKVEYRVEKNGIIHVSVGKLSFDNNQIKENVKACMSAIIKSRPSSVKGTYFKKFSISSTMGPGIKVDKTIFIS